ncbi:hypothetical protein G7075_00075 [Phycicoccus sp. HDW14]|uniref:HNH endonuclease n=1 Tax=Phycicoccus sp. HDW14 TaxID=2714941 RepID=UPI00140A3172|nr:hypothetical protein [Phycicoccus sp. HDW14]QIM19893.1 hypothetical protein G7075_00075 [Phycicoccus sp. HDW14]
MPWLKSSDKSGLHIRVLAIRRTHRADARSANEVFGFVSRCATMSAGYMTDYVVDIGTAELIGGDRAQLLLRQAVEAGLMTAEGRGRTRRWRIVEDDDLWHIRLKEDVAWDRQRDQDRRNPELTARVLLRDGDQCRYCRVVLVSSKDTRSGRGATYDHLNPGTAATFETYVRCCHKCNSTFKHMPRPEKETHLLPPPPMPYFSKASGSRKRVEDFLGHPVPAANDPFETQSTSSRGSAATGAHPGEQGGAAATGATSHEGAAAAGATLEPLGGAPPGPPWSEGGRRAGTGRAGPGQAGTGAGAPPAQPQPAQRSRGARGRRGGDQ